MIIRIVAAVPPLLTRHCLRPKNLTVVLYNTVWTVHVHPSPGPVNPPPSTDDLK